MTGSYAEWTAVKAKFAAMLHNGGGWYHLTFTQMSKVGRRDFI